MGDFGAHLVGLAGSVRSIQFHPTLPLVSICGLDRCDDDDDVSLFGSHGQVPSNLRRQDSQIEAQC